MHGRMTHTATTPSREARETYSLRGLLAYLIAVPAFVALLAVPGPALAFALGALTAVLLDAALGLV